MVKKRNEAGVRGLSPEGAAAEAKRVRRQTAKDGRARGGRNGGGGAPEPQPPLAKRAAFSAATSDPRAASGVLVACLCGVLTVRLRARSCACPPRLGSPLSRDETLPGTGPLQRRSNARLFARRGTIASTARCTAPRKSRAAVWPGSAG